MAQNHDAEETASGGSQEELFDEAGKSRGFYSSRNTLNDLTGREWVYWTKSVITTPYPPNLQHRLRSRHGAQKPPDLCADLIRVFTKSGEWVLDPLAGVGGTLIGAARAGRKAVGIEINREWTDVYAEVCRRESLEPQEMVCGDCREELPRLARRGFTADFILTDVPYWRMDKAEKSQGKFKRVGGEARENRRSKLRPFGSVVYADKEDWLSQMRDVFEKSVRLLSDRRYLAVFIGDMYNRGRYHFLSADLAGLLSDLGLTMKANLIWYDGSKALHVYGYRYEYIPSLIHQSILVFRKQKPG